MKSIFIMAVLAMTATVSQAQIKNAQTASVKVYGNCGMCETNIEKAGSKSKMSKTDWNEGTGMAEITYDAKQTSLDAVLKNIALAGYDNPNYKAPTEVYNNLHGCCKYDREKTTGVVPGAGTTEQHSTSVHGAGAPAQAVDQLATTFSQYFNLKNALVATNAADAASAASAMLAGMNVADMNKMKMSEHGVWMKVESQLKADAGKILSTKDIGQQRSYFISLSTNMYELLKAANTGEKVYLQHCPMANEGKGANWLSKESAVKNPYYGAQMLTCGNTIETIQ